MVAGISLLFYEQILFLMPTFRGQLVPTVQACPVGLENYEVHLLQTQIASTCCWGIRLCSCDQFPLHVKFYSFFVHDPNILDECCGVFFRVCF